MISDVRFGYERYTDVRFRFEPFTDERFKLGNIRLFVDARFESTVISDERFENTIISDVRFEFLCFTDVRFEERARIADERSAKGARKAELPNLSSVIPCRQTSHAKIW